MQKWYSHSDVWSAGFLQYIAVLSHFEKYSSLTHPLINFHTFIMKLSRTYLWELVLTLTLIFHKEWIIIIIIIINHI